MIKLEGGGGGPGVEKGGAEDRGDISGLGINVSLNFFIKLAVARDNGPSPSSISSCLMVGEPTKGFNITNQDNTNKDNIHAGVGGGGAWSKGIEDQGSVSIISPVHSILTKCPSFVAI